MALRLSSIHDAQAYAEGVFRSRLGPPQGTSVLPNSRNFLFRMEDCQGRAYVVKVYAQTSELIGNCEQVAYTHLELSSDIVEAAVAGVASTKMCIKRITWPAGP